MCELLGLSFNEPVNASVSFTGFRKRGSRNPHGWGIAYYPDRSAQIFKEDVAAPHSKLSKFLLNYGNLESKLFIAHVRLSSVGVVSHANTHPFSRELNGREYVFAHNGTISHYRELTLGRFKPIGTTDSEHLFCHILDRIEKENPTVWSYRDFEWLKDELQSCNRLGSINCLMSDGELLFCYRDMEGCNNLKFIERRPPHGPIKLKDEDLELDLGILKSPTQRGYVVATRELTDEKWRDLRPGSLTVFKNGEVIFGEP